MARIREINTIDQLAEYREAWAALLAQTAGRPFFQSLEWLEAYWRHFGRGQHLRVLLVIEAGRVEGILPLVVRRESTRLGWFQVLTYPLDYWGSFYGPIGPDPEATLQAGLQHIHNTPRDWDILELRWLGSPQGDLGETERAMHAAGFPPHPSELDRTFGIKLEGTWEEYYAARCRKWRRNLRYRKKRLASQGQVTFQRYRPGGLAAGDADPRWDLYDACEEVAQRSWQGSSTDGTTLSHAAVRPFLRDAHAAAVRAGAVDLNLLLLDGRPAAFLYGYQHQGYFYGLRMGYDASLTSEGTGTILLAESICDSFRRGDRYYDLGVGYARCKRHVTNADWPILRLSYFRPTMLRAQLVRLKRWAEQVLPIAAGRVQDGTTGSR